MMLKTVLIAPALLLVILGFAHPALAHSVETDYSVVNQTQVEIRAKFSTGEPFQFAPVKIYLPTDPNHPWLESKTDQDGLFSFQPDRQITGDWTLKLGQADHADALNIPVNPEGVDVNLITNLPEPCDWRQAAVLGLALLMGGMANRFLSNRT